MIVSLVFIIVVGIILFQVQINNANKIKEQKLALINQGLSGTLVNASGGGWLQDILNSSSVTALFSGFATK